MSGERESGADPPAGPRRIDIETDDANRGGGPGPQDAAGGQAAAERPAVELTHSEYEELKTLARERDEFYRRLQRAVADYQNLQKRLGKFRESTREMILRQIGEAILPLADSLALALEAAEKTEGGERIVEGLRLFEKEFYGALAVLDIRPIEARGRPFDPHFHEALFQEPTAEAEPNTVLRELKRGFVMGDVVLRPTQVVVAGGPMTPAQ
jgi:molecular chaperone GrpE